MTCGKCSSVPKFKSGVCKVYIHSSVNELLTKIKSLISNNWKIEALYEDHIEFQVQDFKEFILKLKDISNFTQKECSTLNILPIYLHEQLNFSTFNGTKTLLKWINILNSKDLIYILENKSLITFFQPIVDIRNNSIFGYELLSRGVKEDGSIMPPGEMFEIAKETELTFNLDRQARETCLTNAAKEKITKKLFINFLPSVIYNPDVCLKTTMNVVDKYNLNPENITFEVVETEDIKDTDHLKNILDFYRKKGFKVALDDLGSGYSSLNNLSKLHPDCIKIDMEIIRDIHKSKLKQSIFEALVSIADTMDILVLAEGVETKEELDFVVSKGAKLVQGYFFGKPTEKPLITL